MKSATKNIILGLIPICLAWVLAYAFCTNLPPAQIVNEKIVYVPHVEPVDTISAPQHSPYQDEYLDTNLRFPLEEDAPYHHLKPVAYSIKSETRGYKSIVIDTTFVTAWEEIKVVGDHAFISVPSGSSGETLKGFAYHYQDSIIIYDQFGGRYHINFRDTLISSPVFYTGPYQTRTQKAILKN